eukprot:CAMPEP_0198142478 /NCGR_PEP_ID=MMETSP1443-20131203/5254_1 /TAXON_ID=186043 /ORGANISM="Entomoneis sp., Strain CCMP2396" /LENGTH=310 /DNA_ID=CAMNT_0043805493 /DNA_START=94 /DNA_END=1026 /DNA_ORIENTATION=+
MANNHLSSSMQQQQELHNLDGNFRQMIELEDAACRAFAAEQEKIPRAKNNNSKIVFTAASAWRERVAQWCYDVIDHFGENRELAFVAMNILDRYTGFCPSNERIYEMEAMAALFLALRIGGSGNLALSQLVSMSRDGVAEKDIAATGKIMISKLAWDQRLLTPADFVRYYVDAVAQTLSQSVRDSILDSAMYLIELAVFDLVLARKRPSNVAATATIGAINRLDMQLMPDVQARMVQIINAHTTPRFGDLSPLLHRLELICQEVPDNQKSSSVHHPHVIMDDEADDLPQEQSSTNTRILPLVSVPDLTMI